MSNDRHERLYDRANDILERRRNGFGEPILWHLVLRRHTDAMILLADRVDPGGMPADPFSQAGLLRCAFRRGNARARQHLAMTCFNRRDLSGYRRWLVWTARAGGHRTAAHLSQSDGL